MLAFACAFTMFAGAAFTDQADIEATEAVEMLAALGVIDGYEDGSYRPNDTVTRAEMAKMIYVARTGSDNADSYKSAATSFTDITNHWAAGYIKYCQALGIIAGKSTTSFDPDATVTGVEAAKMLLVTMGYQADRAGLEGTGWDQKTLGLASENNLLDDVNADLYAALPRQYAAQVIYNTLDADRVIWSTDANGFDYYTDRAGNRETVGYRYLKLCTDVGTLTTIDEDTLTISISASDVSLSYHKPARSYTFTKVAQDYSDLLGQKVRVMFKDGKLNDVLGVYADIDNTTYTVNANAVELDNGKIKFNGSSYNVELDGGRLNTYIDGDEAATGYTPAQLAAMKTSANVLTFADTDGNNKIDTVYVKTVLVEKITYAASSQIVAGGETYKYADENIADGLAKDDWVVITKNSYNDNFDIVKADMIEASIQGYKAATGYHQYKVDGTWYNTADNNQLDASAGDTAEIVIYNGIIFYADKISGTAGSVDVAVVVDTGSFNQVKLAFFDGTEKTVTLDDDGITGVSAGQVYVYEISGDEYKLKKYNTYNVNNDDYTVLGTGDNGAENDTVTAPDLQKNASTAISANGDKVTHVGGVAVDDSAKVILYSADKKAELITGKQFKTIEKSASYLTTTTALAALSSEVNGLTKVSYLAVNIGATQPSSFQTNDNYAYVIEKSYKVDNSYIGYTIFDGENTIEVTEKQSSNVTRAVGDIVGYSTIDEDNVISDVTLYGTANYTYAAIRGVNDDASEVTFDGSTIRNITSDTKIILINSEGDDDYDQIGVPGDTISKDNVADEIGSTGVYVINAKYIADGTDEDDADLAVLVVDVVNNKMAGAPINVATPSAANVNAALEAAKAGDTVTVASAITTGTINVPAGVTLQIGDMAASGVVFNVDKDAEVVFETGFKTSDFGTVSDTLILTANSNSGWDITAAPGTTMVVSEAMKLHKEAENFYATDGTSGSNQVQPGTYTYYAANSIQKDDGSTATHAAGWYTATAVTAVKA